MGSCVPVEGFALARPMSSCETGIREEIVVEGSWVMKDEKEKEGALSE